jgi:hypothetical protein
VQPVTHALAAAARVPDDLARRTPAPGPGTITITRRARLLLLA